MAEGVVKIGQTALLRERFAASAHVSKVSSIHRTCRSFSTTAMWIAQSMAAARRDICSMVRFSFPDMTLEMYGALTSIALASCAWFMGLARAFIIRARPAVNSNKASDGQSSTDPSPILVRVLLRSLVILPILSGDAASRLVYGRNRRRA